METQLLCRLLAQHSMRERVASSLIELFCSGTSYKHLSLIFGHVGPVQWLSPWSSAYLECHSPHQKYVPEFEAAEALESNAASQLSCVQNTPSTNHSTNYPASALTQSITTNHTLILFLYPLSNYRSYISFTSIMKQWNFIKLSPISAKNITYNPRFLYKKSVLLATTVQEGTAMACTGLRKLDLRKKQQKKTCEVLLGGYGFVHLHKLLADGGVNRYLLPQQFHLFVGHYFNVKASNSVWGFLMMLCLHFYLLFLVLIKSQFCFGLNCILQGQGAFSDFKSNLVA